MRGANDGAPSPWRLPGVLEQLPPLPRLLWPERLVVGEAPRWGDQWRLTLERRREARRGGVEEAQGKEARGGLEEARAPRGSFAVDVSGETRGDRIGGSQQNGSSSIGEVSHAPWFASCHIPQVSRVSHAISSPQRLDTCRHRWRRSIHRSRGCSASARCRLVARSAWAGAQPSASGQETGRQW